MVKSIILKVHGYYETLDADGNVKTHHLTGELPFTYDSESLMNETLLSGDFSNFPSPRTPMVELGQTNLYTYMTNYDLCRDVLGCDVRYVSSFTLIETEPAISMLKFVFLDKRKQITDYWDIAL